MKYLSPHDLAALFQSAPNLVLVLDPDFTIVATNDALLRSEGLRREDVIGQGLFDVFPDRPHELAGAGATSLGASLRRVLETRRPEKLTVQGSSMPRRGGGGGESDERYWSSTNYPVLDAEGRVTHLVCQSEDVTELVRLRRRDAELVAELAEANNLYQAIYDQGVFAGRLDLDGRVTDVNRSALVQCGYVREDVIGKPFWECGWWNRSPEVQAWVKAAVEQAVRGEPFRGVSTYFCADGSERVVEFACMPIKDEAGRVLFVVPTGIDVTERVQAEKEAQAKAILESITDAFFAVDREWRFIYVNSQAERLLGQPPGYFQGRVIWDEFPGLIGSEFERAYRRAAEERVASSVTSYYPDHDRWYEVHTYPSNDGVSIYFRDVSERMRTEAAIREGQQRLRLIMSNVKDHAIFTLGLGGEVTDWNAGAEKVFGHGREIIGRPGAILFTPEDREAGIPEREREICSVKGRASDERWHLKKDGTCFYASGSMEALRGEGGDLRGFVKVVRDQTENKQAEEERQELTARLALQARVFDTALSNTPDLTYTFDLEGRFTYANRALAAVLETTPDRIVGKNFFDLDYPDELAARLQRQIRQVIETRCHVQDETPYSGGFGNRIYEYIFVPVLAPDGSVEAVAGSTRDITERQRAEAATRHRAVQLQRLAEVATRINSAQDVPSVIGVVTEEARNILGAEQAATSLVLSPNHHQPVGFVSSPGRRLDERVSSAVDATTLSTVVNEQTWPVRIRQEDLGTDPRWHSLGRAALAAPIGGGWLAAPLVGRNGKNIGIIEIADKAEGEFTEDDEAILVQLSRLASIAVENARLYEELRANDRRKDEFLAMLAHELRNPLAAIGNAVNVSKRSGRQEHIDWSMGVITRQMKHLTRLIDDLLDVSRITRGKIELRRISLDATPILESAAATVRPLVEERKHSFTLAIARGGLWVDADPTRLEQVVVNLLNNAAKYSENAGSVRLSAGTEGNEVVISVEDKGLGIPPEKLPQMFELFAQGDRSLARSEGGLGIGLTVVKKLVEMHGGSVTAQSEGLGKGSTFTVRLPGVKRPTGREADESGPAAAGKTSRILVVDDNVDTARGMAGLLKLLGHDVATAHTGPEALRLARTHRPEFILLDIGLPGMDGYEVASRLRQEEESEGAFIVAVSGYGQDEDRRRSKAAGFDHHLIKPLDQDALISLLSAGVGGQA